ncbi:hypothetical protein [Natrononativus amylolyticus]|uniref:hypothetical protein n=1 Tax=Natrononativus amylolyticus TaxID=2963434 RepID=UPI0020CEAE47|nr:hypothetical protein [Natrononativus amylolyticus]
MAGGMRARLLRTDLEAWNDERYVYVGGPMCAVLGLLLGQLFGVHLVSSAAGERLVVALVTGLSIVIGLAVLAALDR